MEYPFNMAVTMETTPHPLLSTEHQLQVKRKIILPDRLIHRLEWRYYVRSDGESDSSSVGRRKAVQRVGRRMRVGPPSTASNQHDLHDSLDPLLSSGYEGKRLMVCDMAQIINLGILFMVNLILLNISDFIVLM